MILNFDANDVSHQLAHDASERYWRRTIEADGYLPAVMFPRVLDHATDTLGIQTP